MKILAALIGAVVGLSTVIAAGQAPAAGEVKFQSRGGARTSLVELYTSEGCSSCPPAEAWLSRLTTSPKLWTEIVPVAFHVDYWDNLGWRDRLASPAWTARQRAYAAGWGSDSVYTPGFVLNGREWRDWSGPGGISPSSAGAKTEGTGQLSVTVRDGKMVLVTYRAADRPAGLRAASVALLGCDLRSDVKAGENSGRSLRHDFVALTCEQKKLATDKPEASARFELAPPTTDAKRFALAVWVEEPGRPGIQQAAGGWLPDAAGSGR